MTRYYAVTLLIAALTIAACKKKNTCENNIIETNFYGIAFYKSDSIYIQPTGNTPKRILALYSKYDSLWSSEWVCGTRRYNNGVLRSTIKIYCNKDITLPDITIPAKSDVAKYSSQYLSLSINGLPDNGSYMFYDADVKITKQLPNKELKEDLYTFYAEGQSVKGNQYKDSAITYLRY